MMNEEACLRDNVRFNAQWREPLGKEVSLWFGPQYEATYVHIHASYRYLLDWMARQLPRLPRSLRGISDGHRGTENLGAQLTRSRFLLHRPLLYDFDIGAMSRYLLQPAKQPAIARIDRTLGS
jgi:hypothetical protein